MRRLAVIPSDPLDDYAHNGFEDLHQYYNPAGFFDEVYVCSPLEHKAREVDGLRVIPTRDRQLPSRLKGLGINMVRAYGGNWPCDMACRFRVDNIPVAVSLHDRRPKWFRPSLSRADMVIAVSEEVRDIALEFCPDATKVRVLPNKVDASVFSPFDVDRESLWGFPKDRKIVLFIGRLSPEKNIETIIRALAQLPPEYMLCLAGPGDPAVYAAEAAKLGVLERCRFLGTVPRRRIPELINAVDCVCNPSHSEAMSKALIEAMACGAALVTSSYGARGVGIRHTFDGIVLHDHTDPKEIAVAVRSVCEPHGDRAFAAIIRANARMSALRFDKAGIEAQEIALYEELLSAAREGRMRRPWGDQWHYWVRF